MLSGEMKNHALPYDFLIRFKYYTEVNMKTAIYYLLVKNNRFTCKNKRLKNI